MPEYLAPGVYIEETSFRSKSIEGVSTSTAGFVGPARFGPVGGRPELIVSFSDFERYYGSLEDLDYGTNYLALGVRSFFEEGGSRCYVTRIFAGDATVIAAAAARVSLVDTTPPTLPGTVLLARFPGSAGKMRVTFGLKVGDNVLRQVTDNNNVTTNTLARVEVGDVVYLTHGSVGISGFQTVAKSAADAWELRDKANTVSPMNAGAQVHPVSVIVTIERPTAANVSGFGSPYTIGEFSLNPDRPNGLTKVFTLDPDKRLDELTIPFAFRTQIDNPNGNTPLYQDFSANLLDLLEQLIPIGTANPTDKTMPMITKSFTLDGGSDGAVPQATHFLGDEDDVTGLKSFEAVEDISIVAAPGYTGHQRTESEMFAIHLELIKHCTIMKYRIAVLDTPADQLTTGALAFRNLTSSTHGAIYYPWIYVSDPRPARPGEPIKRLKLPPSGFVAGIYARNDVENAVFKAPANEVVREAIDFETRLSKAHQEVLNPEGVNCFRFFEGRGMLLWGARTISDDPEWKYVSLRRYFAYLERSIERGTQWAVFENNGPQLWNNVRRTIEDFLYNEWRNGGLLGEKPEKAFFVRCDRSTMTQNDLDNGRLICLIGVAPVRPAEFVIFRIGQWTADSEG